MRKTRPALGVVMMILFLASPVMAGDFDWVGDFNVRAGKNPRDFRVRLATRFQTGDEQINAAMNDVPNPSDAYIVLRLAEMSEHPLDRVMAEYEYSRKKGWDVIAKRLGDRPGPRDYRKLEAGQDLYGGKETTQRKKGEDGKRAH